MLVRDASSVFIVGANSGFYALQAASASLNAEVHAFEPYPPAFGLLSRNIGLNDLTDRITTWPIALGDRECTSELLVPEPRFGSVMETSASLAADFNQNVGERIEVPVTTVDAFAAERKCGPSVLLIDVEGFELQVIRGAVNTLRESKPYLIVEVFADRVTDVDELDDIRKSAHYECWELGKKTLTRRSSVAACTSHPNQIWVPESSRREFVRIIESIEVLSCRENCG
ncbi:FkbM family methyltransferase [Pirellulimonas nuda]|nr:FkbM family methyltransferase [Pirellulimonas nuda]